MTVILHDAKAKLTMEGVTLADEVACNDLVYADDTLLIDICGSNLQKFMEAVQQIGGEVGLTFNWGKLELLQVRSSAQVYKPDGTEIASKSSMKYLGSVLSSNRRMHLELSCRIGLAMADFKCLKQVWSHANLSTKRKLQIFTACIESKLLYGLQTAWLSVVERRRLDGFQARCLRQVLWI